MLPALNDEWLLAVVVDKLIIKLSFSNIFPQEDYKKTGWLWEMHMGRKYAINNTLHVHWPEN